MTGISGEEDEIESTASSLDQSVTSEVTLSIIENDDVYQMVFAVRGPLSHYEFY